MKHVLFTKVGIYLLQRGGREFGHASLDRVAKRDRVVSGATQVLERSIRGNRTTGSLRKEQGL